MAKDLVTKLLKTNPSERISLDEILDHPWFQANPAIKPTVTAPPVDAPPQKLPLVSDEIKKENYQVVSKPSIANKAEA